MGVKSLWSLLTPVGRPVILENMEGKSMAIDSSIWIYQFQATMRDKDGKVLVNAHVVGFLRRICKLLFYGIKPVFVFDGGAPALKRMTINERKKKKIGAAESHARIAERLLAAQMRREAVSHAQSTSGSKGKGKVVEDPVVIDENTVYFQDLMDGTVNQTPVKQPQREVEPQAPPSTEKKNKWRDFDPYRLPDVDMDATIAKAARSSAPDPRLATEDELRSFIDMLRPEDLDVTAPAFRELPTEVQYEIIGDLRLKSRQTSHKRLETMLKTSKTPLDFSKLQILNLKQRNSLTQQLLTTTDSIGQAHVNIPVRIASERNREYLLIKNEGAEGGWVLGIRDEGTQDKPIQIDEDEQVESDEESDEDMEEISIPSVVGMDEDLREFQREQAITGAMKRQKEAMMRGRPKATSKSSNPKRRSLFISEDGEKSDVDDDVAAALQASLDDEEAANLQRAIQASRKESVSRLQAPPKTPTRTPGSRPGAFRRRNSVASDDETFHTPSRLDAQLKFANTGLPVGGTSGVGRRDPLFSGPNLLDLSPRPQQMTPSHHVSSRIDISDETPNESAATTVTTALGDRADEITSISDDDDDLEEVVLLPTERSPNIAGNEEPPASSKPYPSQSQDNEFETSMLSTGVMDFESPHEIPNFGRHVVDAVGFANGAVDSPIGNISPERLSMGPTGRETSDESSRFSESPQKRDRVHTVEGEDSTVNIAPEASKIVGHNEHDVSASDDDNEQEDEQVHEREETEEHFDAAAEVDAHEEEGDFANFLSQVKGRDLDTVRREIDDEIRTLNHQRKAAMRDSEDITQAMIAQIMTMLRLFGIPYITAPMEAEAQCAELVTLGLVDGVITDDSDVFLFGAPRVFKNMFNQSKTVECFLLTDLARELGLDRDKLVRLAYLLGSDYVDGLAGVGPVVAMELLSEFPGEDGLFRFKDWWLKVQSGRDKADESSSSFKKRFKKRFKELYLAPEWPNSAVKDAYYHPAVDSSEEPFKWGMPDLDGLRLFLQDELAWNQQKADDLLLPIIQKMSQRSQANAMNRQGTLGDFFDSGNGGMVALEPRKKQAYTSKRLQELVSAHRSEQRQKRGVDAVEENPEEEGSETSSQSQSANKKQKKAKALKKKDGTITRGKGKGKSAEERGEVAGLGIARGREKTKASRGRSRGKTMRNIGDAESSEEEFRLQEGNVDIGPTIAMTLRKRGDKQGLQEDEHSAGSSVDDA